MSHHSIDLLPGIIPLAKPARLAKKRRLRKARRSEGVHSLDGLEMDDFMLEDDDGEVMLLSPEAEETYMTLSWFSTGTMGTLLKVQEDS